MTTKISSSVTPHLTVSEVRTRLVNKTVEVIQEISADNIYRKSNCGSDPNLLEKGIFATDYYFIVIENNQPEKAALVKAQDLSLHGYASPEHFDMVPEEGFTFAKKIACFVLKRGALASDAIHALKEGLTIMGCGESCQLAQYKAIEDIWKPEKFNALFAADSQTPLIIGSRLDNNPLSRLRNYMTKVVNPDSTEIKEGDHVYIKNAKTYILKHLTGASRGYNVICVDDTIGAQKFTTVGLPLEGVTHSQCQDIATSKYNLPYRSMEAYSETTRKELCEQVGPDLLKTSQEMAGTQITLEQFKEQEGGNIAILNELDAERITAIANASLEEARVLLDSYDVRKGTRQVTDESKDDDIDFDELHSLFDRIFTEGEETTASTSSTSGTSSGSS